MRRRSWKRHVGVPSSRVPVAARVVLADRFPTRPAGNLVVTARHPPGVRPGVASLYNLRLFQRYLTVRLPQKQRDTRFGTADACAKFATFTRETHESSLSLPAG